MTQKEPLEQSAEYAEILVDESIYPLEIGKVAAYFFIDRAKVEIFRDAEHPGHYSVRISPKNPTEKIADLESQYANELLNTSLKESFTEKFSQVREQMIVSAISNSLKAAMVTEPDQESSRKSQSIDDVLKELATEFDLEESRNRIENL